MAQQVKQFLEKIFDKEVESHDLKIYKDKVDEYNTFVDQEINVHCHPYFDKEMNEVTSFNLVGHIHAFSDRFYKMSQEHYTKPLPRYIFKISEYPHERFGTIWACYVSFSDPSDTFKNISECLLVADIKGEFKIIADMVLASDAKEWRYVAGDEDTSLRLRNLGTPVKVERYTEPNDEWSLKEYLKDK